MIWNKVKRYSGSTENQSTQRDDHGKPLYKSVGNINENRNLDICVTNYDAGAVVVVRAAGKLCFRYTNPPSTPRESFLLIGITTDSLGNILTSDYINDCFHIIDQDGHFLRYIHKFEWVNLCVDSRDNLFVAELFTVKVKKI